MSKFAMFATLAAITACSTLDADTAHAAEPVIAEAPAPLFASAEPLVEFESEQEAQAIVYSEAPSTPTHTFSLRRGESVHHFARWSETPIEDIAERSSLTLDGAYPVGTEVVLQLTADELSIVEARRDSHHQTRATSYLTSRGSSETTFYKVRTGDTAWTIARTFEGMPVWLLESLNPSANLDKLYPGQELMVPVFNDVTVSVDED